MNADIKWITPSRQGNSKLSTSDYAFYLANQAGGKAESRVIQGSVRVTANTMKKLRWLAGDRILLGSDDACIYIKRVQSGGYALSPVGGIKKNGGKVAACVIKTARITFLEPVYCMEGDYAILDDGTIMIQAKSVAA